MLSRRNMLTGVLSALALAQSFQQAQSEVEGYIHYYVSTAFDDSGSMEFAWVPSHYKTGDIILSKRQANLRAWAQALESREFETALRGLGPKGVVWFDAFYWSESIRLLIQPIPVYTKNPSIGLKQITSILWEEGQRKKPWLDRGTKPSVAMQHGISALQADNGRPPAFRRILNITTDTDESREGWNSETTLLNLLQQEAAEKEITINGLILGHSENMKLYMQKNVMAGRSSFVRTTSEYTDLTEAWRDKFYLDIS